MIELGFVELLKWCFWKLVPAFFVASALWTVVITFLFLFIGVITSGSKGENE